MAKMDKIKFLTDIEAPNIIDKDEIYQELYGYSGDDLLIIPDRTTEIEEQAYVDTNYKCVVVPSSVKYIGSEAFAGAPVEKWVLSEGLEEVGVGNFWYVENITIPSTATSLSEAFVDTFDNGTAKGLKTVTLAEGRTTIPIGFIDANCTIIIPNSVISIEDYSLGGIQIIDLTAFVLEDFPSINEYAFGEDLDTGELLKFTGKIIVSAGRKQELLATPNWLKVIESESQVLELVKTDEDVRAIVQYEIGGIETALDNIIAIQNSLIGGEKV